MPVMTHHATSSAPTGGNLYAIARDLVSRHYKLFLYVALGSFALIMGAAIVTKKQYRSDMKYLVQNARSTAVLSSDRSSSSVVNIVTEEQMNSELEILQSEDVLSAVADPGWKAEDAKNRTQDEVRKHSLTIKALSEHLTVDPIAKEDVMSVSYIAGSPQEAYNVLSSLSAAYLVRHEQLRRPTGASSFFVEQAAVYEEAWKTATQNLVNFQQQHKLVSVSSSEESLQRSIVANEEVLQNTRLKLSESDASIHGGESLISDVSPRQQTQQRKVPNEQLLQQLKSTLVGLSNRRVELLNRYKPTDRLVTELDQQISETNTAIKAESSNKNVEDTTDVNPSWQQLKTSLLQEQVNHHALQAARGELEQQLGQLRSQMSETQGLEVTYQQLRARADEAQSNYKTFVEKRDLARAEDAMDANKILNVTVMQTPTFHYAPVRPRPMLNLALGIPTALFLGIAVVYFAETNQWGSQPSGHLDGREEERIPPPSPHAGSSNGRVVGTSFGGGHVNGAVAMSPAEGFVAADTQSASVEHEEVAIPSEQQVALAHRLLSEHRHRSTTASTQLSQTEKDVAVQMMTLAAALVSLSLAGLTIVKKNGVAR